MAARLTIDRIIAQMRANDLRYFTVRDGGKDIFVQDANLDFSEVEKSLQDFVGNLEGDCVTIRAYNINKRSKAKGGQWNEMEWTCTIPGGRFERGKTATGGAANESLLREIHDLKLQMLRDEFTRKFEDVQREKSSGTSEKIIGMLETHADKFLPVLLGLFTGQTQPAAALAGPGETETEQVTVDQYKQRLNAALRRIAEIDNEYLLVIEKIADIAQSDPAQYSMYRKALLAQ